MPKKQEPKHDWYSEMLTHLSQTFGLHYKFTVEVLYDYDKKAFVSKLDSTKSLEPIILDPGTYDDKPNMFG